MKKEQVGKLSSDALAALEKEHGQISIIKMKVSDTEESFGYLKEPDRDMIAHCLTLSSQKKTLQCGEAIIDNCFVAGDPRFKDKSVKNKLRIGAAMQANKLIDWMEGELGNSSSPDIQ